MKRLLPMSARITIVLGLLTFAPRLGAQRPGDQRIGPNGKVLEPAGPHTIIGFVADTLATPLDSVEVFIASLKMHATASPNGTFRFEQIKTGTYAVSARRFGYFPQVREVVVGDSGGVVTFALVPRQQSLPTVVTSAPRGGLSGVIGDSSYNILEGADVTIVGTDHHARTDSSGAFYMEVKPGRYMVHVERPGYASRLLGVTIPNDSGRRILVGLAPRTRPPLAREEAAIAELSFRLTRRSVMSKIYTREDINHMGMTELRQIATAGAFQRVDESCQAIINGGPVTMPIWLITAADIESVEIYPPDPESRRRAFVPTSINGNQPIRTQGATRRTDCPVTVYVWLRR
jgi:carboxypeptidase family protein